MKDRLHRTTQSNYADKPNSARKFLGSDLHAIWYSLTPYWRRRFWVLMALSVVASASEVLSIGALLPFLIVLTDPQPLWQWPFLGHWLKESDLPLVRSPQFILIALGLLFGTLVLLASLVRCWLSASCADYAYRVGGVIGQDIFRRALLQPYSFHLTKNSSEIIDVIGSRVQTVVSSVLMVGLQLLSSLVIVVAIAGFLMWLNPWLAIASLVGFGSMYLLIFQVNRRRLQANSERMSQVGAKRYQVLQEGIGGVRDIQIDGTHEYFIHAFEQVDTSFRQAQSQNAIISTSPRYLVEGLSAVLLAGLAVIYAVNTTDLDYRGSPITGLVPMFGVLVLTAQRLLPMLQQIYAGWTSICGATHALHIVRQWLMLPTLSTILDVTTHAGIPKSAANEISAPSASFKASIELIDISFAYQSSMSLVLNQLNLRITKGQTIGLFGATGVGKSTLLDILMGLLKPTSGKFLVDGRTLLPPNLGETVQFWRRNIAHVPQDIFLVDSSIASNVAFGSRAELIDNDCVRRAIDQSQLSEFVDSLPQGVETVIGERGIQLSGGQRQRIGIARALYKRASLLVLDEPTSALDHDTEEAIIQSLANLNSSLTIVIVSHRLSALQHCDVIYQLVEGRLIVCDKGGLMVK
jgi:ATP-binding cassette, subfamily B, bacterial PglK